MTLLCCQIEIALGLRAYDRVPRFCQPSRHAYHIIDHEVVTAVVSTAAQPQPWHVQPRPQPDSLTLAVLEHVIRPAIGYKACGLRP